MFVEQSNEEWRQWIKLITKKAPSSSMTLDEEISKLKEKAMNRPLIYTGE